MGSASGARRGIKARFVAAALVTVILAGCAVGPNYKRQPIVPPVNMRSPSGEPGVANRDSAFFLSLLVSESEPLARFEAVRTETARLKSSHAADGIDFLGQLVDRTGSTWLTGVFAMIALRVQPYNQIVSNVPGPQYPLYVLGARLLELYPMPARSALRRAGWLGAEGDPQRGGIGQILERPDDRRIRRGDLEREALHRDVGMATISPPADKPAPPLFWRGTRSWRRV